ncbi:MAG TPA: hypothetical protein VGN38_09155 [Caulobacteraceae bacterium]|nr:hypothetical protein [Caulobacteraceae bacterium]
MIGYLLRRIGLGLAAAAIAATSAAVIVVALAFALYAWVRPVVGPAGAGAVVAGAAALLLILAALSLVMLARGGKRPQIKPRGKDAAERVVNFVRDKPVTAIAGALGVGFMAIRNPRYLGAAIRSFIEGREAPKRRR